MTTSAPARRPGLSDLSLRHNPKSGAERGFVLGGVGSGKSTLADHLIRDYLGRYRAKGGRVLILDSKPRYRADYDARGRRITRRYRRWAHGATLPGAVVVDDPADLELAWSTGARAVIMQGESSRDIPRLVAGAGAFLRSSKASRPQLLYVDETLDFFHGNGAPIGGDDAIVRAARAGRERGCGALYGSQRTRGIPPTLMGEMDRCYCLRVDYVQDVKRLAEMGMPRFTMPIRPHAFMYWWKGDYSHVHGPYRLDVDK